MKRLEDAREFAGADWQKMKLSSRAELLRRNGAKDLFASHSWWQLPPSVKTALIKPLLKNPEIVHA